MYRNFIALLFAISLLAVSFSTAWSQANWEGPTGVFLNPLALTVGQEKTQASLHYLNLQPAGSLFSAGVVYGENNWEAGITHASLSAGGPAATTNLLHGKYIVLPFKGELPQLAVGAILRNASDGPDTSDFYLVATKVFQTKLPIITSLTIRNTNGLGSGLFGKTDRTTSLGGVLGVQVSPRLIVAIEYYAQPEAPPWRDLAVRYIVDGNTFLDAGIARLNSTFDNQIAVALTRQW